MRNEPRKPEMAGRDDVPASASEQESGFGQQPAPAAVTAGAVRPSAKGKYAHLGASSEEYAGEKQIEIEREARQLANEPAHLPVGSSQEDP